MMIFKLCIGETWGIALIGVCAFVNLSKRKIILTIEALIAGKILQVA